MSFQLVRSGQVIDTAIYAILIPSISSAACGQLASQQLHSLHQLSCTYSDKLHRCTWACALATPMHAVLFKANSLARLCNHDRAFRALATLSRAASNAFCRSGLPAGFPAVSKAFDALPNGLSKADGTATPFFTAGRSAMRFSQASTLGKPSRLMPAAMAHDEATLMVYLQWRWCATTYYVANSKYWRWAYGPWKQGFSKPDHYAYAMNHHMVCISQNLP